MDNGGKMANITALDPVAMNTPAASSRLVAHKPSPWFNVLAIVVVIIGIIYAGYHLADDLSVVHDTRAYPFILLGIGRWHSASSRCCRWS